MDEFNAREFSKKYKHTHIGVVFRGQKTPSAVAIRDVHVDNDGVWNVTMEEYIANGKTKIRILPFAEFKVLPHPDKQLVEDGGKVYLFTRRPERQWQKGINGSNSHLHLCVNSFLASLPKNLGLAYQSGSKFTKKGFTLDLVQKLYTKTTPPTLGEAIEKLDKDKATFSVKLSDIYFITLTPRLESPYVLFRNNIPIAFFDKTKNMFTLIKDIYEQEVIDFCFRNKLDCGVRRNV